MGEAEKIQSPPLFVLSFYQVCQGFDMAFQKPFPLDTDVLPVSVVFNLHRSSAYVLAFWYGGQDKDRLSFSVAQVIFHGSYAVLCIGTEFIPCVPFDGPVA